MNDNTLETKMTRIEQNIALMKTNLRLAEDEVIEKVADGTNLKTLSNIFIQETEPSIKDGIWIKAKTEENPFEEIKIDKDIIIPGKMRFDQQSEPILYNGTSKVPLTGYNCKERTCVLNGKIYYIMKNNISDQTEEIIEIDPKTYATKSIGTISDSNANRTELSICTDGTYLYACDIYDYKVYRFKPGSTTVANYTVKPTGAPTQARWHRVQYDPKDNSLWVTGEFSYSGYLGNYNLTTGVSTYYGSLTTSYAYYTVIGDYLLLYGKSVDSALYDPSTRTSTVIDNLKGYRFNYDDQFLVHTDCIYVFSYAQSGNGRPLQRVLKIDKETFEAEEVTAKFLDDELTYTNYDTSIFQIIDNKFYVLYGKIVASGVSYNGLVVIPMDCEEKSYDTNAVIFMQSPITRTEKQASIWTYPFIKGKLKQSFFDVYYYNKEKGYIMDYPTYYGDGEKWIKFKN